MAAASQEELRALLQHHGVRPTENRLLVLQELARAPDDATAQEIWGRLRVGRHTTGLATVYRTLALLYDAGMIHAFSHHAGGEQCYRLCSETHHHHHHHLLCDRCHRVVEVEKCDLDGWVNRAAKRYGFVATHHRVEITGVCADCRASH